MNHTCTSAPSRLWPASHSRAAPPADEAFSEAAQVTRKEKTISSAQSPALAPLLYLSFVSTRANLFVGVRLLILPFFLTVLGIFCGVFVI